MKDNFPTVETIRQYLLGRFDDQEKVENHLSEQMLFDSELSEIVDSVEDEIIEDYLDDAVSPADREAIQEYFLRPAERREKLQLARLLRHHFEAHPSVLAKKKLGTHPEVVSIRSDSAISRGRARFWIYCEVAAILLVAMGAFHFFKTSRTLQSQLEASRERQRQVDNQLERAKEHAASLEKQLELVPPVTLSFLKAQFRGDEKEIEIEPWRQRVTAEIELANTSSGEYDVRLVDNSGHTVWYGPKLHASPGELRFDVPAKDISPGDYCFRVSSLQKPYCFRVKVSRKQKNQQP